MGLGLRAHVYERELQRIGQHDAMGDTGCGNPGDGVKRFKVG